MSYVEWPCPDSCTAPPPEVNFDFCDPAVHFGEIDRIFVASRDAAPVADVESLTEWNLRIDPTGLNVDDIRQLDVSGNMPKPEREKIQISRAREISTPGKFMIEFDIDDISDENYEFMRATYCNTVHQFWWTAGDVLFGGLDGAGVEGVMELDIVIERGGKKSLHKLSGTITWEETKPPYRYDNPFD